MLGSALVTLDRRGGGAPVAGRGRVKGRQLAALPPYTSSVSSTTTDRFRVAASERAPASRSARSRTSMSTATSPSAARPSAHGDENASVRHSTASSTTRSRKTRERARGDRRRARADRGRNLRYLRSAAEADRRGAPRGDPVRDALHRRQAAGRSGVDERAGAQPGRPRRLVDGRAHTDLGRATRRSRRGAHQWVGARRGRRRRDRRRPGDQARRLEPRSRSARRSDVVGPFSIHHVQNSGHRVRALLERDPARDRRSRGSRSRWMLVFFARSARGIRCCPSALGLVIGGSISNLVDRVRLGHVTDFIDIRYWPAFNLADTFIVRRGRDPACRPARGGARAAPRPAAA